MQGGVKVEPCSFLRSALDGCERRSASRPGRFTPQNDPRAIAYDAGWAPEPAWTLWGGKESHIPTGNLRIDGFSGKNRSKDFLNKKQAPWPYRSKTSLILLK
jgi:hypothetical protein